MDGQLAPRHADHVIAELADRQHAVVAWRQLRAAGLGYGAIAHRVRRKRLFVVHRGVYAVGRRRLTREGAWIAAVLACGDRARLSRAAAAALWEVRPSDAARIDVTVETRNGRARRDGIRIHRVGALAPVEIDERDGIPVTSVARTLLDLAAILSQPALARAVERAETLRLFDLGALTATLALHPKATGRRKLVAVLDDYREHEVTRSDLEARFRALCSAHGIPRPRMNALAAGHEVDALWREQRVAVELDTRRYHATRAAFERDRARDAELVVAGYRVVRFTDRQLATDARAVARTLQALVTAPARA